MLQKLLRPSLFRELLGWQLLVMMLALTVNLAINLWRTYEPQTGNIDTEMYLQADAVARFAALNPTPANAEAVARQVKALNERNTKLPINSEDFGWQVWSTEGQLLSSDGMVNSFPKMPPSSLETHRRYDQGGWRLIAAKSPDGKVWVVIGQTLSFYRQIDDKITRQVILVPLVYAGILMVALWIATWRGLTPLQQLSQRVAARKAGSTETLANKADPIELQPITAALDAYALREAELRATEQRFFADAAHELRTPLAVIGAQAHVLSQEKDATKHPELLQTLQHGVQRTADVLSKVLTLSRLDATGANCLGGSAMEARTNLNLGQLLRERVEEMTPRAIDQGHDLGLSDAPSVQITANAALLCVAIDNLIDNALLYCPSGPTSNSRIDVTWGYQGNEQGGEAWWAIEDNGPGIALTERERVFNRFERGTGSLDVAGSGLGLAIAREVARRHGGSLRLETPATGYGCRFVMTFPMGSSQG